MKPKFDVILATALAATLPAQANDRPYQVARTAVLDDEEHVRSFETWAQRFGSVRGFSIEPEYTFGGGRSVQVELSRYLDRHDDETGHEAEIEFKQLFNDVAVDGWALGLSLALAAARTAESDGTVPSATFKVPLTISLGQGGGFVHLNTGIGKARDERRAWTYAVAIERELIRRTIFFGEWARTGAATFAQVGARHWIRHEKLAVDLSLQQQRAGGTRSSGFILGLGYYDF